MSTRQVTMDELMSELSFQLGEVSVPTSGVDNRKTFLQRALEDAWKVYPWPFSLTDTTLSFSNGVATLPDDFLPEGHYYLFKDGKQLDETDFKERGLSSAPSFYLRFQDGAYEFVLLNSADFEAEFRYQYTAPLMSTTVKAFYPNPQTLALGAMRQVVKADNPDVDNAQEVAAFQAAVQEDYAPFNRIKMRHKRGISISERRGHSTGEF